MFMKKHIIFLTLVALLVCSCRDDDDQQKGAIDPISNPMLTPYYGSVILNWTNPTSEDYYYTLVSYTNAEGEVVNTKVSCYDLNDSGQTEKIIGGFTDMNSYTFTLIAYNRLGVPSEAVTVTGAPLSTEAAKDYVVSTIQAIPAVQGAVISWKNETGVQVWVKASFNDGKGVQKEKIFDASTSGKGVIASFVNETTVTISVLNASKTDSSSLKELKVTPAVGKLDQSLMSIYSASSDWGGYKPTNMIDGDINTYWHTQLTGYPHNVVVDLGNEYYINKIELVRRQDDGGNGQWAPNLVQFLYSMDGTNFTNVGEFAFDVQQIYGHEYSFIPIYARYIKMVGLSGGQPWMHMAEFDAFYVK